MPTSYRSDPRSPKVLLGEKCTLTAPERLVYLAMSEVADGKTYVVEISISELSRVTGLAGRTVVRARQGLIEAGAIELVEDCRTGFQQGNIPNLYRLTAGHLNEDADDDPRAALLRAQAIAYIEDRGVDLAELAEAMKQRSSCMLIHVVDHDQLTGRETVLADFSTLHAAAIRQAGGKR